METQHMKSYTGRAEGLLLKAVYGDLLSQRPHQLSSKRLRKERWKGGEGDNWVRSNQGKRPLTADGKHQQERLLGHQGRHTPFPGSQMPLLPSQMSPPH